MMIRESSTISEPRERGVARRNHAQSAGPPIDDQCSALDVDGELTTAGRVFGDVVGRRVLDPSYIKNALAVL